jgi:hypothetical protein
MGLVEGTMSDDGFLLIEDPDFEGSPRTIQKWPRILEWFEKERHSRIKPRGFAIIKGATTSNDLYRQIWEDSYKQGGGQVRVT